MEFEDLRVPTATLPAEVALVDGDALRGRFFLPASGSVVPGMGVRPDERLNDESEFFPFWLDGHPAPLLVGKAQVAWVTIDERLLGARQVADEDAPPLADDHRVAVDLCGRRLEGVFAIDLPGHRSRVLDYLNGGLRFLPLHANGLVHFLNRARIVRVYEGRP